MRPSCSGWREAAANHVAGLTSRQRQIMDMVLAGHPSKNIAADLGISQRTVENHRASIMKKTGIEVASGVGPIWRSLRAELALGSRSLNVDLPGPPRVNDPQVIFKTELGPARSAPHDFQSSRSKTPRPSIESRRLMGCVARKSCWLFGPYLAQVLVWSEAYEGLEPAGEVIGYDEDDEVVSQAIMFLVAAAVNHRLVERSVHALHLAIRPWMFRRIRTVINSGYRVNGRSCGVGA